jgi:hypothetical protein
MNLSDSNVDALTLYGTKFVGIDQGITFGSDTSHVLAGVTFQACGQVDIGAVVARNCTWAETIATDASLVWNSSIDIVNCKFIANTTGAAVEHTSATGSPFTYSNLTFSGNTYDVNNTSGSTITVTLSGISDASSYTGTLVNFQGSATLSLTVKDEEGDPVGTAYAYIDDDNITPFIMNTTTNATTGIASTAWTGGAVAGATWRVRKYGYKPWRATADVPASGTKDIPVTLITDPQQT